MDYSKKVAILMPVYNGEKYLNEAIESILNQTYKEFDFLIINDGSSDRTEEIIKSYNDKRIIYIENEKNIGIVKTLNKGLDLIKSKYIVRMDADDISSSKRVEKQVKFMDKNMDISVSGTSILLFNREGRVWKNKVRQDPTQVKTQLLFNNALMHPSVIIRKSTLLEGNYKYDEEDCSVEDFGLWQKISFTYKLSNIPEVLLKYRVNEVGLTQVAERDMKRRDLVHMKIYMQAFDHLGIKISTKDLEALALFLGGRAFVNEIDINTILEIIKSMKVAAQLKDYDMKFFDAIICSYFRANCLKSGKTVSESNLLYKKYFTSFFRYRLKEKMKFAIKRYLH